MNESWHFTKPAFARGFLPIGAALVLALATPATGSKSPVTPPKTGSPKPVTAKADTVKTDAAKTIGTESGRSATSQTASPDSTTLKGKEGGTQFPDMTVRGEDRIRIDFERPELLLDLDAKQAPGLDRDRTLDLVERGAPDLQEPLLASSAGIRSPFTGRPWLSRFSTGAVARFRPSLTKVQRWTLQVADSRGTTVARFQGEGRVPDQIAWDGRTLSGDMALPGLTYSYVFEAYDEAGNKRNFMGDAFTLKPYLRQDKSGMTLLVSGADLGPKSASGMPSSILLEAASWLNQLERVDAPIVVETEARTREEAAALAARMSDELPSYLLGPKTRLDVRQRVAADAPETGVCIFKAAS